MIFSSAEFVLAFLPIVFAGYFLLNRTGLVITGKLWLIGASLVFYSYWTIEYLPLLLGSTLFNFLIGTSLSSSVKSRVRGCLLTFGIAANLGLLGYFKYSTFFASNVEALTGIAIGLPQIVLPLGISFFTFTQIAFLVDSYRSEVREYDLVNYLLFVTFFPHLIAGPILHHREMMSQFRSRENLSIDYDNIAAGLFIFSIGLFKKVAIADTFAVWANAGFDGSESLSFFAAWATSFSYTFQLYFDFSGYCDMAIGASLLFNIWLPINFNSPYKATDIQEFWRRWHITLSRFLRDYLYIPFGGNRGSEFRIYLNLFTVFLLGGLWHGANWMFVIWGALHGLALIIHRVWKSAGLSMPVPAAWVLTFLFVNVTWVFFRAGSFEGALRVLRGMSDPSTVNVELSVKDLSWGGWLSDYLVAVLPSGIVANFIAFVAIAGAVILVGCFKNSTEVLASGVGFVKISGAELLFCISMLILLATASSVFLYYNF